MISGRNYKEVSLRTAVAYLVSMSKRNMVLVTQLKVGQVIVLRSGRVTKVTTNPTPCANPIFWEFEIEGLGTVTINRLACFEVKEN